MFMARGKSGSTSIGLGARIFMVGFSAAVLGISIVAWNATRGYNEQPVGPDIHIVDETDPGETVEDLDEINAEENKIPEDMKLSEIAQGELSYKVVVKTAESGDQSYALQITRARNISSETNPDAPGVTKVLTDEATISAEEANLLKSDAKSNLAKVINDHANDFKPLPDVNVAPEALSVSMNEMVNGDINFGHELEVANVTFDTTTAHAVYTNEQRSISLMENTDEEGKTYYTCNVNLMDKDGNYCVAALKSATFEEPKEAIALRASLYNGNLATYYNVDVDKSVAESKDLNKNIVVNGKVYGWAPVHGDAEHPEVITGYVAIETEEEAKEQQQAQRLENVRKLQAAKGERTKAFNAYVSQVSRRR